VDNPQVVIGSVIPGVVCSACGGPMVLRRAKNYDLLFAGCKAFPKCQRGEAVLPPKKPKRQPRRRPWPKKTEADRHMDALGRAVLFGDGKIVPSCN
jgi:ssDNA-binding Zn-finger/Zn-ribbon topoisomerase 1